MPLIGHFTRARNGYARRIRTLTVDVEVVLVPAEYSNAENAPDYRLQLGSDVDGPEVGAAWMRVGEKAGDYIALILDGPAFSMPIRVNLFQPAGDKSAWDLHWSRSSRRSEQG